jgi:hypothetical protein
MKYSLVDRHKSTHSKGKQTAFGMQHEFIMHTDVFEEHSLLIVLHGSKIEHKLAGAQ